MEHFLEVIASHYSFGNKSKGALPSRKCSIKAQMSAFNEVNDWAPKLPNTDFKIIGTLLPSNSGIV